MRWVPDSRRQSLLNCPHPFLIWVSPGGRRQHSLHPSGRDNRHWLFRSRLRPATSAVVTDRASANKWTDFVTTWEARFYTEFLVSRCSPILWVSTRQRHRDRCAWTHGVYNCQWGGEVNIQIGEYNNPWWEVRSTTVGVSLPFLRNSPVTTWTCGIYRVAQKVSHYQIRKKSY